MDKQLQILRYLAGKQQATLSKIAENMPWGYYTNGNKHFGNILSNMVKNGKIERLRPGVFKIKTKHVDISPLGGLFSKTNQNTISMSKIQNHYHDKIEETTRNARFRAVHLFLEKKGIPLETYMNVRIANSLKEWFSITDLMVEFSELQNQTS